MKAHHKGWNDIHKHWKDHNPEDKDYLDMLSNMEARHKFFGALTSHEDGDHSEVTKVKNKIQQLIDQELEELGFKNQLDEEERNMLAAHTYDEVATKSNFYFKVDEGKGDKNLKVYNFKAPGNKYRHPNVILPHENVNIQKWIDTKSLTKDKLYEIYAYYTLLVDMHIAQIRPGILDDVSYIPPQFNQVTAISKFPNTLNNKFFDMYHRFNEPSKLDMKLMGQLNALKESQPTTDHWDDRGTKYDVEWTEDQKFPHVATRLGYPELREEPIERILGWERAQAHPGYQFQPFVQTPSLSPDPSVNFEEGETIYENHKIGEWIKFWKASAMLSIGLGPGFYVFEIYQGDGAPSLQWMNTNWNFFDIPRQFQDGGDWGV